jgi:hypothetical protein
MAWVVRNKYSKLLKKAIINLHYSRGNNGSMH